MGSRKNKTNYREEIKQAKLKRTEEIQANRKKRLEHVYVEDDDIFIIRLNKLLNEFILDNDTSMSKISMDCGFGSDLIARYIREGALPNANTLVRLCRYFNVSADWLLGLSNEKKAVW